MKERTIVLSEGELRALISESVSKVINESIFEKKDESSNNDDKKKQKSNKPSKKDKTDNPGISAQAIDVLNDPMINNAEVGRELKDAGILHGSEDTIRSWVSKQRRGERPLRKGEPTAVLNISSAD